MRLCLVLVVLLLGSWPLTSRAEFADGSAAYDGGDYQTARAVWRALAEEGDAAAQVALADLHLAGNGGPADPVVAARWFRAAAEQGDPLGQLNLGDLYSRGLGVERNLVEAYVWFSLSAAQGRRWPAARAEDLRRRLSSAQLEDAESVLARRAVE